MADVEKSEHTEHLERVRTEGSKGSPDDSLEKLDTLAHVDLGNRQAFKGDDSDGKVHWTLRKLFAAGSLAMLYTGPSSRSSSLSIAFRANVLLDRFSDPSILCGSHTVVHCLGRRSTRCDRLAASGLHFDYCIYLPVCGLPSGSIWQAM